MAPSRGIMSGDLLLKLFLVGASTFGCLLWASYILEQRAHHTHQIKPTLTNTWKKMDTFVSTFTHTDVPRNTTKPLRQIVPKGQENNDDATLVQNVATASTYEGNIFLDWMGDSDDFDYVNYKSLESLLNVYPRAAITVNLIAANGAHYYKMGNLISKHYIQKYLKYRYNVQMKIVYRHFRVRFEGDVLPPGAEYWNKAFDECCESNRAVEINKYRYIPAHLYFYLRFFNLWSHGGIYSDFTWYHRRELPALEKIVVESAAPIQRAENDTILDDHRRRTTEATSASGYSGAIIKTMCSNNAPSKVDAAPVKCQSSTLLAFSAGHPALFCMLMQYNATTTPLMTCLNRSTEVSGVLCVIQALSDCFASTSARNSFLTYHTPGASDSALHSSLADPLCKENAVFSCEGLKKAKSDHVKEIPRKEDSTAQWLASSRVQHAEEAHNSVHSVVNINGMCELHSSQYHALLYKHEDKFAHTYTHNPAREGDTDTDGAEPPEQHGARHTADFSLAYTQTYSRAASTRELHATHTAAVWLGAEAYAGDWAAPEQGSALASLIAANPLKVPGPYYNDHLWHHSNGTLDTELRGVTSSADSPTEHSALRGVASASSTSSSIATSNCNVKYASYPLKSLGRVSAAEVQYLARLRNGDITHLVSADPQYKGCSKYKFDVTIPDKMNNQANVSCALHFVVPGYMKAGTTYMFGTLMTHPQLLNTLRGVTFKETGCYSTQYTQLKPWRSTSSSNVVRLDAKGVQVTEYRNRMHCFPFVETHEQMYYGDGTVWYAFHPEVRAALLRDNPELKVLFSVRNPVHRTESQHRFSYRTLVRLYTGDLNEIVPYLLDPASLPNSDGESLVDLRKLALSAVEDTDPTGKKQKIEKLVENYQKKPQGNKKYAALNQFLKYSIYFPTIYSWTLAVPARNLMVAPVEHLQVDRLPDAVKVEYVRNLTTAAQYSAVLAGHAEAVSAAGTELEELQQRHGAKQDEALSESDDQKRLQALSKLERDWEASKVKINKKRNDVLNQAFLTGQYNRLFRFLGLPELSRIVDADSHQTGDKDIHARHKLNATTRCLLTEFYRPFNMLLEDLLGEPLGYIERVDSCP